jgi:hypothetical protein
MSVKKNVFIGSSAILPFLLSSISFGKTHILDWGGGINPQIQYLNNVGNYMIVDRKALIDIIKDFDVFGYNNIEFLNDEEFMGAKLIISILYFLGHLFNILKTYVTFLQKFFKWLRSPYIR